LCTNSEIPALMADATPLLPGLSPVAGKSLTAKFDAGRLSSDGGVIVLREAAMRLGLAEAITAPLVDHRDPSRVQYSYAEMALARMVMIAAGYEDCDDIDTLKADPAFKIAVGRAPDSDADLMSQPTLSRLENLANWRALARIGLNLIDLFCKSYARPPTAIVLDIDDTDDPVHGQQELALFNAHYDCTCFQPIHIFEAMSGKPILSLLRPGKRPSGKEVARVLRHVVRCIRKHWPSVRILVRGDSHYLSPETLDFLQASGCDYIIGLAINEKLKEIAAPWLAQCDVRRSQNQRNVRRFHQFQYAARSWSRKHKVIARIEATDVGADARFIVTNLDTEATRLYDDLYCQRGEAENRIKEAQLDLFGTRASCHKFLANQFRLLLAALAYTLMQRLREVALRGSELANACAASIRVRLLKIGVAIIRNTRRVHLMFASHHPMRTLFATAAARLGAQSP